MITSLQLQVIDVGGCLGHSTSTYTAVVITALDLSRALSCHLRLNMLFVTIELTKAGGPR